MKKLLAILITTTMLFAFLTSCKGQKPSNNNSVAGNTDSTLSEIKTDDSSSDTATSDNQDKENSSSKPENNSTSSDKKSDKNSSKNQIVSNSKKPTSSKPQISSIPSRPTYPVITPTTQEYKEIKPIQAENYYGWQYLKKKGSAAEQKAYQAFESAFSQFNDTLSFDFKVTTGELERAYQIYMEDHPEVFFLGSAAYSTDSHDNVLNFTVKSDMISLPRDTIIQMKHTAQDKAYDIILKLFPNGVYKNEIETVRAIHDYLVNNIKYDTTHKAENSHNMYGALINGTAVCEGYAESFMYITRLCGIECIMVNGTLSGVSHVWNMVKLDGEWYHIDVTSDDPILKGGEQVLRFEYFNLTETEIKKSHVIKDNIIDVPKATATKYNFFKYYGLEYSAINNDAFISSISFSMKNGYDTAYFKFINHTPSQAVDYYLDNSRTIAEIVNNNRLGKKIIGGGSVNYSQNKQKNILNLKLKYQ